MSIVYITQEPMRWDHGQQRLVSKFDLAPAAEYGEPIVLVEHANSSNVGISSVPLIRDLRHKLRKFSDDDYIVPAGDPRVIAAVVVVASSFNNGRLKLLTWDKYLNERRGGYVAIAIDVSGKPL